MNCKVGIRFQVQASVDGRMNGIFLQLDQEIPTSTQNMKSNIRMHMFNPVDYSWLVDQYQMTDLRKLALIRLCAIPAGLLNFATIATDPSRRLHKLR